MTRRKTDSEFRAEVKALVGDEYTFLEPYKNNRTKIKVRHNKCGYVYEVRPYGFIKGSRCLKCTYKSSYLKHTKTNNQFISEVKAMADNEYTFLEPYKNCKTKIKVRHNKCGTVFAVMPNNFLRGTRCPKCSLQVQAKKMTKTDRQFEQEVREKVGNEYTFLEKYAIGSRKMLVRHNVCGYIYKVKPYVFLSGRRCPKCSTKEVHLRQLKSDSEFKAQVRSLIGNEYTFLEPYKNANSKIKIKHNECSNVYLVKPASFLAGSRCPFCQTSKGEKAVQLYLINKGILFQQQYKIANCYDRRPLPFDFAVFNNDRSLNCLIEYQGMQHFVDPFSYKDQWFNEDSILSTQKHDVMKLQYCKDHGIKLIRINHPQTSNKSNSIEFIKRLVNRTLNKELHVV